MSHKSARIATMIESFRGRELDAHYLGYFHCFNHQLFYECATNPLTSQTAPELKLQP